MFYGTDNILENIAQTTASLTKHCYGYELCDVIEPKNTILDILGLLGVPKLQNMYTLAQWEHGNMYGNAIVTWELVWELVSCATRRFHTPT